MPLLLLGYKSPGFRLEHSYSVTWLTPSGGTSQLPFSVGSPAKKPTQQGNKPQANRHVHNLGSGFSNPIKSQKTAALADPLIAAL